VRVVEGSKDAKGLRFGIVVARFNDFVTNRLLDGALEALRLHGARDEDVTVVRVPGSMEIPLAARRLAKSGVDAVVALGCVLRGGTPHFEYVASAASRGVVEAAGDTGVPVTFGVITADTLEQAMDRAGGKVGNRGAEAAVAAVEMARALREI
jgi:6,7-dimethyl-8-ribityllumazine synthase